jgi:hypothetical protein
MRTSPSLIPLERVQKQIYLLRGRKVLLSQDLAALYGVPVRVLNQAVSRNRARFPDDFMFQLDPAESENLKSQFVISSWGGARALPCRIKRRPARLEKTTEANLKGLGYGR